jgi:hypothetical protein
LEIAARPKNAKKRYHAPPEMKETADRGGIMKTSSGLRGLNVKDAPISSSMHFLRDNSGCAAPPSSIICSVRGSRGCRVGGFCSVATKFLCSPSYRPCRSQEVFGGGLKHRDVLARMQGAQGWIDERIYVRILGRSIFCHESLVAFHALIDGPLRVERVLAVIDRNDVLGVLSASRNQRLADRRSVDIENLDRLPAEFGSFLDRLRAEFRRRNIRRRATETA